LDTRGSETEEYGKNVEARGGIYGDPAEGHRTAGEGGEGDHIDWANVTVGDYIWDKPAEDANGVHEEEESN